MGRRDARKITRRIKMDDRGQMTEGRRRMVACGRISNGISETYIPFRVMPTTDEIATTAIRKVIRSLKNKKNG